MGPEGEALGQPGEMTRAMPMPATDQAVPRFGAVIEDSMAASPIVLVCEHASNHFPALWGDLGLDAAAQVAHIAWDPGALWLARGVARRLGACLVHAPVSRLVYDLNRAPDQEGAMPARSEIYDIPGNVALSPAARATRTQAIYTPFHSDLRAELNRRAAAGPAPVVITVHSFTPIWHGTPRAVQFGVIHDADERLARAIVAEAGTMGLTTALNAPYSAMDGVTHTLKVQATPYGLLNAMLEVRNDLIATPEAAEAIADLLAPVLARAVASLTGAQVAPSSHAIGA